MTKSLNKISQRITQPDSQGSSQAMLYATGMTPEDMNKPQVGIASVWYEGNPCQYAFAGSFPARQSRSPIRRVGGDAIQYHRCFGRHLHGNRWYELLSPVA